MTDTELWVICPVCRQPNPAGTHFCKQCWGAIIPSDSTVTSGALEELSRQAFARAKRRKTLRRMAIGMFSFIAVALLAYFIVYYSTDLILRVPQQMNSVSLPGEWAMFRHDPAHSGSAGATSAPLQGTVKWTFTADGPIHSSPAVAYGTVYFGDRDKNFYAVDAASGAKRWEFTTGSWINSSPAVANGIVYFGSNDGKFYALDAKNGEKLWEFKTTFPIESSPAVADGRVYFGSGDYNIYALDAISGTKLWEFYAEGPVLSSPVVSNGVLYIGSGGKFFYALHPLNGNLRLHFMSLSPVYSAPAASGDTAYFINSNGKLYAIDGKAKSWPREHQIKPYWIQLYAFGLPGIPMFPPQSGLLWGIKVGETGSSSPAVAGDSLYVGSGDRLIAIDLKSTDKRWEYETGGIIRSSPVISGSTVYAGSEDGRLYAIDAATGEKLWDILTGGIISSSPAVVDGTLYVGSQDGKLYAIE